MTCKKNLGYTQFPSPHKLYYIISSVGISNYKQFKICCARCYSKRPKS